MNLSRGFLKSFRNLAQVNKHLSVTYANQARSLKNSEMEICNPIAWVDIEMTGLNLMKDKILEVSFLVTDGDLNIRSKEINLVIHQPDEILNNMNEWCMENHEKSGLTEQSKKSTITIEEAEKQILQTLHDLGIQKRTCPVGGNSVMYDRMFMSKFMPQLHEYLHYRTIDVSTVKELARRWNPEIYNKAPLKKLNHRALDDIKESIQELSFYKNYLFPLCDKAA